MQSPAIRRAIISVSDKTGLVEFARALVTAGVEIYSTGGTRQHLEGAGLAVQDVAAYTGFPEMMHGRLKTLHPKIFGGLLGRHDHPEDLQAMEVHGIASFELAVVNLYPFEATVARASVTFPEAIEQIDIGGPSLVRAAAKNHAFITIATTPSQYQRIAKEIQIAGCTTPETRRELAAAAFALTARYDAAISAYFLKQVSEDAFPPSIQLSLTRQELLRYGENPHQQAAVYAFTGSAAGTLLGAEKLNGKELSYNNLLDLQAAWSMVRGQADPACVVIKHNNSCGAAAASDLGTATRRALDGDPVSAFGSVIGFNRPVDAAAADVLTEPSRFVEAVVAPRFEPDAFKILTTRPKWRDNVRLLAIGDAPAKAAAMEHRQIDGGFLVQDADVAADPLDQGQTVTSAPVPPSLLAELAFAWDMVRHVKSNAIVLCAERSLIGVGAGQMSRVDSVEIAIKKAGERARGAVLASDAFFPFADSIHAAAAAGVAAVIQPGGSRRDDEVVAACNQHNIAMIFTGRRHFKH